MPNVCGYQEYLMQSVLQHISTSIISAASTFFHYFHLGGNHKSNSLSNFLWDDGVSFHFIHPDMATVVKICINTKKGHLSFCRSIYCTLRSMEFQCKMYIFISGKSQWPQNEQFWKTAVQVMYSNMHHNKSSSWIYFQICGRSTLFIDFTISSGLLFKQRNSALFV